MQLAGEVEKVLAWLSRLERGKESSDGAESGRKVVEVFYLVVAYLEEGLGMGFPFTLLSDLQATTYSHIICYVHERRKSQRIDGNAQRLFFD